MRIPALACICAVGFASSANYTNHAPMVQVLAARFHFHLAAAGLLTTGIFLTHMLMQVPGGHLADRIGARPVVFAALGVICLGNFAIGFAAAYWHLLACKILIGLGTGASFVGGARYVISTFTGPRLHMAQGLYGGSLLLGSGFVIFAVPILLSLWDWRGAFFSTATLAAAVWLLWFAAAPPPPNVPHRPVALSDLFKAPQLWLLGIVQMASFGLVIVVGSWVTTYLQRSVHLPLVEAGRIGSVVLLLGIMTRPLGGNLVPRLGVRRLLRLSLSLSVAGCFLLALGGDSVAVAATAILLLGVGCGMPYAAIFHGASSLFPSRAGAAMGVVNSFGILMILVAPPLVGQLVEWSGAFRSSFLGLGSFTLFACLATFGLHHELDATV